MGPVRGVGLFTRVAGGLALLGVVIVLIGWVGGTRFGQVRERIRALDEQGIQVHHLADDALAAVTEAQGLVLRHSLESGAAATAVEREFDRQAGEVDAQLTALGRLELPAASRQALDDAGRRWAAYVGGIRTEYFPESRSTADGARLLGVLDRLAVEATATTEALDRVELAAEERTAALLEEVDATAGSARTIVLVLLVAGVVLAAAVAVTVVRSVANVGRRVRDVADRLAGSAATLGRTSTTLAAVAAPATVR